MINISGHLREERKITGYYNQDVPLIVNCCGKQVFQTQDYFCNRKNGRLDYQIIYIHRGSGHFYLNNEWITLSAGNIVLYRPGIPQYYSYYAKEKPEIYWIHFTGNECENILKQYFSDEYLSKVKFDENGLINRSLCVLLNYIYNKKRI